MILPIFKNVHAHLFFGSEFGPKNQFRLERLEKTFRNSVIPTVAFPAHTLLNLQGLQDIACLLAGVLNASVGVKDHIFCKGSVPVGHSDCWCYGARSSHAVAY